MSVEILLPAVAAQLATALGLENGKTVDIQPFGQPTPKQSSFVDLFVGIDLSQWEPGQYNDANPGLHEVLGFDVVISKKVT
jgi:hypothetical protein